MTPAPSAATEKGRKKVAVLPTPSAFPLAVPAPPPPASVVTTAAGTHGVSDGVALPLAVRLAVIDGDAGETDREPDTDAERLPVTLGDTLDVIVVDNAAVPVTLADTDADVARLLDTDADATAEPVRLGVTLGVADADVATERDRLGVSLGVTDAEFDKVRVGEEDGEAVREALTLPDAESDGEAARDDEPNTLALRVAVTDGEPLGDWQVRAMRRTRLLPLSPTKTDPELPSTATPYG
jgi:hypothetical protein